MENLLSLLVLISDIYSVVANAKASTSTACPTRNSNFRIWGELLPFLGHQLLVLAGHVYFLKFYAA